MKLSKIALASAALAAIASGSAFAGQIGGSSTTYAKEGLTATTIVGAPTKNYAFASDINAKKLVDKLKAAGYKAYTEPRLEQGATVFKVRVGPTPGKAEAERLRQRIEAQFEARGMLVPSR